MTAPSLPLRVKYHVLLGLSAIACLLLLILHLCLGSVALTPKEVLAALFNQPAEILHRQIVWDLRLPRALIALLCGAMLGLAGAILQSITQNPLAEPGLTGTTSGGVLLVVFWLTFAPQAMQLGSILPLIALVGGLAASGLVYTLSRQRDRSNPLYLILNGVIVSTFVQSLTSLFLVVKQQSLGMILLWLIGSLNGRVWVHLNAILPWSLVALPLGLASAGIANVLHLGDDMAVGLGLPVEKARAGLFLVAAMMSAIAVSVVGAVGFIGLIGPHIARQLVGLDARRVFPLSALLTTLLLLTADLVAQAMIIEVGSVRSGLPVGAVTALLGAPFFLYLVLRKI
ncbi:iron ABC transporter permease [Nostoc sp. FACHB-888]|uniref:FecCD family ABC transporter permease n=1 Tax=Nostoc sp. FACHB-888 TaxID=2692842 RepID=UPI0016886811|nr:iron ABC transporter permease [Nostoc sp. FACHB-888]MBD2246554.1 iron ABC transporter permease [Nostoc sp. FACHB-888]